MKRKKRVFSPFQYAVSNVFYALMYIIGAAGVLGSLAYGALTLQPRVFGEQATARATKYYAYNNEPDNGKLVQYTYTIKGHVYHREDDIGERAYKEQPKTFAIWYMPESPTDNVYISIRDYWEAIVIAIGVLGGAFFLWLPSYGRSIDRTIEAGKEITPMRGCICERDPTLMLSRNNTERKAELLRGGVFVVLVPFIIFATFADDMRDMADTIKVLVIVLAVYALPFAWHLWLMRTEYRGHSLRCRLRGAWLQSLFGE